jgi:hypothetical protein
LPEFNAYFASLNIDDVEFSKNTFNAMDVNNDGELSKEGKYLHIKIIIIYYKHLKKYFN